MTATLPGTSSGGCIHPGFWIAAVLAGLTFGSAMEALGDDGPIPQDTARIEKRRKERLEWNLRTTRGAYDKVGKKSPRWDKPAHEALDVAARIFSAPSGSSTTLSELYKPAKTAIDAGCDDPYIDYLYSRSLVGTNSPGEAESARIRKKAATALAASKYPVFRRALALQRAVSDSLSMNDEAVRKDAERSLDRVVALLPESIATDERTEFWEDAWFGGLMSLIHGYHTLGVESEKAYERINARLADRPELKVLRLRVRGRFYIEYGWEARTSSFAHLVPEGGFEKLEKRLEIARKALEEAWSLRPDPSTATELITIDKGITGDRATMERWFDRGMKADGDNRSACWSKLDWLDPKWHGDEDGKEMLAFGKACLATKNWYSGITLLAADAHWRQYVWEKRQGRVDHMKSPEVWKDIQPAFDEYLQHYPYDDVARSRYATFAALCGHYREAHAQYELLGDRLTQWTEAPILPLEQLKKNRSEVARFVANPERQGWRRLSLQNDEARWSIEVPVAPVRSQQAGSLKAEWRNVWTFTTPGVEYMVRVQPIPPALATEKPAAILDAMRAAVAGERGGKPRDQKETTLGEQPAQEYLIDVPALRPRLIRVRTAVIGKKVYEFSVTASEKDLAGQSAVDFLGSFTYQKQ